MSNEQQPRNEPEHEEQQRPKPSIYVASLSDYNAGRLHGTWIDADQSAEDLQAAINEMLAASPEPGAEEWAIHDFEGFGPLRLGEYENIEHVAALARGITEHGPAFAAFANFVGLDGNELLASFEDSYLGHWESTTAYAEDWLDAAGLDHMLDEAVPSSLRPYVQVNVEALARDMEIEGSIHAEDASGGGVYLFQPP
jgi:antirestriction protein